MNVMKLASALSERADIQRRLSELSGRLANNAKVQDGDTPAENPEKLLAELDNLMTRLEELISRINLTNSLTKTDGITLTELISRRDCLKKRISLMRGFLNAASEKVDRYSRTEIRIYSAVDVEKLQKDTDRLSKQLRETDEKIQELNWTTELI